MRNVLMAFFVIILAASVASATTITWTYTEQTNGDGSSRYKIKAQTDDMAIVGFTGTFYCSSTIAQTLGDLIENGSSAEVTQIDSRADAMTADYVAGEDGGSYDRDKDTHVYTAFDFLPEAFTEATYTFSGEAASIPAWDSNQGLTASVTVVQIVAPSGLTFDVGLGSGDLGYRGNLGLWDGTGDVVKTDAPMGIPEPATMGLLALGGLALLRRRRR